MMAALIAPTWPVPWQDACGSSDASVLVTTEVLEQLRAEMAELVARYRRVGQGNPSARRIAVYTFAYPIDLGRPHRAVSPGALQSASTPPTATPALGADAVSVTNTWLTDRSTFC